MIIGLGHRRRMGKDQLAKFIISVLREHPNFRGKNISRRGFADPLYDICYMMYSWAGFKRREYYEEYGEAKEQPLPPLGKSPRQILIEVGNHMRQYDPHVWLNMCLRRDVPDVMVVTDLRYPNEFNAIQDEGGVCLKVLRPGIPEFGDEADTALKDETRWDSIVDNDSDLKALYLQAKTLVERYCK